MTTVKLKLPPGFYKNGTEYQAAGRWYDGDLIRWHNDNIKPIFGWQRRTEEEIGNPSAIMDWVSSEVITDEISGEALTDERTIGATSGTLWPSTEVNEAIRSGVVTSDEGEGANVYLGSNKKIYMVSDTNAVSDVTPVGFVAEDKDATFTTGYGLYRYSYGLYSTPRPSGQGVPPNVFSWGFSSWGIWPIACARAVGASKLKVKRPSDAKFVDIATSPAGTFDAVVTDERFIMTFGNATDFRRVQWCDQENFDMWTPAIDNQAGGRTLAGVGRLVRGIKVIGQILILSDNDAFTCSYIGPPYVYGFTRAGSRCGIIGPEAVAVADKFAVWLGQKSFWKFDGTLQQLRCEVLDFYLEDHNPKQRSKTAAFTMADFSEVWWLYQSRQSPTNEVDSYIVYNYDQNIWYNGRLDRTYGVGTEPLLYPLMTSTNGTMYDHEVVGAGFEGRIPFIISGPLETTSGDRLLGLAYVYPDEKLNGDVLMDLQCRGMPNENNGNPTFIRTFELLSPTSTHGIMGRDVRMKLYASGVSPFWTVGDFRVTPLKIAGGTR